MENRFLNLIFKFLNLFKTITTDSLGDGGDHRQRMTLQTSETRINFAPQSGYAAARFSHEFDPEAGLGSKTLSGRYRIETSHNFGLSFFYSLGRKVVKKVYRAPE